LGGEREAAAPAPASPALQPTGPGDTNGTPSRRPEPSETTAHRPSDGGSVPRRSTEYELTIVLPRSDDMDDDIQLLKQVHEVLSDFEGADRYRIHIPNGAGTVELEFPNATTRYCVNLTQRIERLVGAGRLSAQQL
jgi:hypothetical protein